MSFIEKLKEDPKCLYLYNWGPFIYGLSKNSDYLAIVSEDWIGPHDYFDSENPILPGLCYTDKDSLIYVYRINIWFKKVLNGDIDCWECACMNKKFILKEHVKLMMQTNPLQLRKDVDASVISKEEYENYEAYKLSDYDLWDSVKKCMFANQIIENHKIVNFKEANQAYISITETPTWEQYQQEFEKPYNILKKSTDEILRRSKIEKILQKQKNE